MHLRLVRPDAAGRWRARAVGESVAYPAGAERAEWATRVPIAAGDYVGVGASVGSGVYLAARCGDCGDPRYPGTARTWFFLPVMQDNQIRAPFADTNGLEALVNVDIEPDADRDGFGDETQDCAPADPV